MNQFFKKRQTQQKNDKRHEWAFPGKHEYINIYIKDAQSHS